MVKVISEKLMTNKNISNSPFEKSKKTKGMIKKFSTVLGYKGIMIIVVLIIVVIFCLQNIESTSVQFLFWKIFEISKLYLIAISIFLGFVLGLILKCRIRQV